MFSLKDLLGIKPNKRKAYIYIFSCEGCGKCIDACRNDAIGFFYLAEGQYARVIHPDVCSGCGRCAKACENNAIELMEVTPCKI